MEPASEVRLTRLLSNKLLGRVERMRLQTSRRFTNRSRGEHVARGGGNSNEFKDFRDYSVGDDVRFVDWNIFARLQRPFVKLFHQEEEIHVVLLVDASTSMDFEGKARRAAELASALGLMGLLGGERVSVHVNTERGPTQMLKPIRGRGKRQALFSFLEATVPGGDGPIEEAVEHLVKVHRGRGVLFVLSDFLTMGDLHRPFNMAFSAGLVPYCLQILGPSELEPELTTDQRLVDSETGATLDVSGTTELVLMYREFMDRLLLDLDALCKHRSGKFCSIDSGLETEHVLTDVLRRRGWVR